MIAIYNATKLLGGNNTIFGKTQSLSDIIYEFELNPSTKYNADIVNCGCFGTQPQELGGYLTNHGYLY